MRNLSGGAVTLRTAAGAGVAVADGQVRLLYADGTDVVDLSPAAVGGVEALDDLADVDTATAPPGSGDGLRWNGTAWVPSARGLDVGVFVPDRPAAGALVFKLVVVRAFTLPAGLTGSRGHAGAAATAQADFDLRKNGSSIGTASFAAGSADRELHPRLGHQPRRGRPAGADRPDPAGRHPRRPHHPAQREPRLMALLFLDGCDLHASHGDILRRWTSASSPTQVDVLTTGGRFGGGAIRIRNLSSEETLTKNLTAPYPATLILGAAVLLEPENTAGTPARTRSCSCSTAPPPCT